MELEKNPEKERHWTSRENLYSPGCVKGYPHHAEGECNTRAFLLPVLPRALVPR